MSMDWSEFFTNANGDIRRSLEECYVLWPIEIFVRALMMKTCCQTVRAKTVPEFRREIVMESGLLSFP